MKVRANDADEGENGRITYHFKVNETDVQETDEFFIHPDTGDLRTKIILDREVKSKYEVIFFLTFVFFTKIKNAVKK